MPRCGETDKHTVRSAVRYLRKCCADLGNSDSGCDQRRVHIWENLKYLIKPRDFKDRTHRFLQAGQGELAAISFDFLHSLDKCRQASTINIGYAEKIDNQPFRFFLDHHIESRYDATRDVQIEFAFERQHIRTIFTGHWKRGRRGFFHSHLQSSIDHHPSVWIIPSTFEKSSIRKSG